jgi:hypothetical protein
MTERITALEFVSWLDNLDLDSILDYVNELPINYNISLLDASA